MNPRISSGYGRRGVTIRKFGGEARGARGALRSSGRERQDVSSTERGGEVASILTRRSNRINPGSKYT